VASDIVLMVGLVSKACASAARQLGTAALGAAASHSDKEAKQAERAAARPGPTRSVHISTGFYKRPSDGSFLEQIVMYPMS
jgi:hypothetical protein